MSKQVQLRRGTAMQNDAFTGALAEVTVDTTNGDLRVHDGSTAGGVEGDGILARAKAYADNAVGAGGVADRTAMAALTPFGNDMIFLTEPGREGQFVWRAGDYSAQVTADPLQGIYVAPASDPTGASGAWVRSHDEQIFSVEWPLDTGLRARSVRDRFADTIDLSEYCNPSDSDSSAGIQAAFNEMSARGGGAIIIPHRYRSSVKITLPTSHAGPIAILGHSNEVSDITWTAADGGITGGNGGTPINAAVDVENIGLRTSAASNAGTALDLAFNSHARTFSIKGCNISGDYFNTSWARSLDIMNPRLSAIENNFFAGASLNKELLIESVRLRSTGNAVIHQIHRNTFKDGFTGIRIDPTLSPSIEGVYISENNVVQFEKGLYVDASLAGYIPPGWDVSGNHFDVRGLAIFMHSLSQGFITRNLIYSDGFDAIRMDNCQTFHVRQNIIRGEGASAGGSAVLLNASSFENTVSDNKIGGYPIGVTVSNGSHSNKVGPNDIPSGSVAWNVTGNASGAGNRLLGYTELGTT